MKSTLILCSFLFAILTTAIGQNDDLTKQQRLSIQKLITIFKSKNKTKIAELIIYPLRREYPLKDVKDKNEFIQRFDDIFYKQIIDQVSNSTLTDYSQVGWRGIMFDDGKFWIDDNGRIMSINYKSSKEKKIKDTLIRADRNQLPKSLQVFEKPLYLIFTKNYKIRIDEKAHDTYRYAGWKINNPKSEPDIIIENGILEYQGSGGNHTITFKNNVYTYLVSIIMLGTKDDPDATLEVSKDGKTLMTENGKIKRN
jgi:hypothetical protein